MPGRRFHILDVFAEEKYAGNQLAVVRDTDRLSDIDMHKIAREMNYSETTFILSTSQRQGGYDVRIFTPRTELPFAGHPTLGTAYVIEREIVQHPVERIILNLRIGQIPVTFGYVNNDPYLLWMKQHPPVFGQTIEAKTIAQVLGVNLNEIDPRLPVQEVSTGIPFIIVPLKTLDAVRKISIDRQRYFELVKKMEAKSILVFCPETYNNSNSLNVRVFAEYYGVAEDPATGSANGCLAGYLVKHRYQGKDSIDIRVEQGYEIDRPSLIFLKAKEQDGKIGVSVGGKVISVAKGELV